MSAEEENSSFTISSHIIQHIKKLQRQAEYIENLTRNFADAVAETGKDIEKKFVFQKAETLPSIIQLQNQVHMEQKSIGDNCEDLEKYAKELENEKISSLKKELEKLENEKRELEKAELAELQKSKQLKTLIECYEVLFPVKLNYSSKNITGFIFNEDKEKICTFDLDRNDTESIPERLWEKMEEVFKE